MPLWRSQSAFDEHGTNLTFTTLARVVEGFGLDVGALFAPAPPLQKRPRRRPRKIRDANLEDLPESTPTSQDAPTPVSRVPDAALARENGVDERRSGAEDIGEGSPA